MASVSRGAASGLAFTRMVQQTNSYAKRLDPFNVQVSVPGGFPYEAYNGTAHIKPWSILKLVENARAAAFAETVKSESFLDTTRMYQKHLIFIVSTSSNISPALYDISLTKAPLELHVKLESVGISSFKLRTTISLEDTNIPPLCVNDTQTALVSKETRRSTPLPDWWKEKYSKVTGQPLKLPPHIVPEETTCQTHHVQVQASDVDGYMHTNWSNFLKYCYDAYVLSRVHCNPAGDPHSLFKNMKQFSLSYSKETNLGDQLGVKFWPSLDNQNLYHFQVLKGAQVVCECSSEFFQ